MLEVARVGDAAVLVPGWVIGLFVTYVISASVALVGLVMMLRRGGDEW